MTTATAYIKIDTSINVNIVTYLTLTDRSLDETKLQLLLKELIFFSIYSICILTTKSDNYHLLLTLLLQLYIFFVPWLSYTYLKGFLKYLP